MGKELKFKCPECGADSIEKIEINANVSSIIQGLDKDGDFDYSLPNISDSTVSHFQCFNCGYVIVDSSGCDVNTNEDLVEWIEEYCSQE